MTLAERLKGLKNAKTKTPAKKSDHKEQRLRPVIERPVNVCPKCLIMTNYMETHKKVFHGTKLSIR